MKKQGIVIGISGTTEIPPVECPRCRKRLEASSCMWGDRESATRPPEPGDGTICAGCGVFLVHEVDMSLRLMTDAEWQDLLSRHPAMAAAMRLTSDALKAFPLGRSTQYTLGPDGKSITCATCRRTSWNENDVKLRYCGHCRRFHE